MVRLSSLGKDGRLLRNCLAKALWEDVEARSKQLGVSSNNQSRKQMAYKSTHKNIVA